MNLVRSLVLIIFWGMTTLSFAQREHVSFDKDWLFCLGDASSPEKDFGCGTEYFNYLTKANSIHNKGPYTLRFDAAAYDKETGQAHQWKTVDLPHDWVVDLGFAPKASHSHGYKTVGYQYPEYSVGWYRKIFIMPVEDKGKHIELQFDGIFRNSRIWVNGFYLGGEESGYTSATYDISEYLNYGDSNVVCVRADATLEEGWFYEGAGIYRHVWMNKTNPVHVKTWGTFVYSELEYPFSSAILHIATEVMDNIIPATGYTLCHTLYDADGNEVAMTASDTMVVEHPHLWSCDTPYLYKLRTDVSVENKVVDSYITPVGIRHIAFDKDAGFLLNGKAVKLKGVNLHQDHAGVGSGMPDGLQEWRLRELKKYGVNAYRSSHNPATPETLDACDRLGILVIDENRLSGVNQYQKHVLGSMVRRDRNHPSVILWSIANEEWGIEWNEQGERLAASMQSYVHFLDPSRKVTVASSSGPNILIPVDVAGYNYIMQNPVDEHRLHYPERCAIGTEEITGVGTRGVYFDDVEKGHIAALNRTPEGEDSLFNRIERGWKFYHERPWLGGMFYWTGFDYRGEPNPLSYPATGSERGVLDYCGFPKDEAFYLKAWWTDTPVLHILPHWNLQGHEGENVDIWVYSNCEEVELTVNGEKLGRQPMPRDGHLSWHTVYQPGYIQAVGYNKGKRVMKERVETAGIAQQIEAVVDKVGDIAVVNIWLRDKKWCFVPDACEDIQISVSDGVRILGVGNGDPAYQDTERPVTQDTSDYHVRTFNGCAQVLLQGTGEVTLSGDKMKSIKKRF
ncbi:MAG: DUF4982 domain-containing protein [Bacteroides sp.]|nr:DUF4982 domain-containing protein [Roseburia sp.]MCM1347023.1 DUF4982 domain-containing protein [Bacteroides sp.]MCM1420326.1 DUF4982 domain-containing protein [Bacteroides sp.]